MCLEGLTNTLEIIKTDIKNIFWGYDEVLNVVNTHGLIRIPSKSTVTTKQQLQHSRLHVSAHQALYPIKYDDRPKYVACCT
jgi:hypothetical protein